MDKKASIVFRSLLQSKRVCLLADDGKGLEKCKKIATGQPAKGMLRPLLSEDS